MAIEESRLPSEAEVTLVAGPHMWDFEFHRKPEATGAPDEVHARLRFNVSLTRLPQHRLIVELSTAVEDIPGLEIRAAFRAVFQIDSQQGGAKDEEGTWRQVGALIAPAMMYPFIRETIASAIQKAGLPPLMPPLVRFASIFDPAKINLPPSADVAPGGASAGAPS